MPPQLETLLLLAPPFIICLSIHEWAHAWVASRLGDNTAAQMGRLSFNPMVHMSLMGSLLPAFAILTGFPLFFGWAKPVPVDSRNFKKPVRDMAIVASAGPISNLILAVICTAALSFVLGRVLENGLASSDKAAIHMLQMAIQLNLFLAFFNLLPIAPLDGSRILKVFVSPEIGYKIDAFAQYGFYIFMILMLTGTFRYLAYPVHLSMSFLYSSFGIPLMIN